MITGRGVMGEASPPTLLIFIRTDSPPVLAGNPLFRFPSILTQNGGEAAIVSPRQSPLGRQRATLKGAWREEGRGEGKMKGAT